MARGASNVQTRYWMEEKVFEKAFCGQWNVTNTNERVREPVQVSMCQNARTRETAQVSLCNRASVRSQIPEPSPITKSQSHSAEEPKSELCF